MEKTYQIMTSFHVAQNGFFIQGVIDKKYASYDAYINEYNIGKLPGIKSS